MGNIGPKPERAEKHVALTKEYVAKSQLQTAIGLWFHYGDAMSIHTLAAAANECYHGIGRKSGAPSLVQTWKKTLPKKGYDAANRPQNFAKHGSRDPAETLVLNTEYAELLMLDAVICHEKLFGKRTALMTCFFARLTQENPRLIEFLNRRRRAEGRKEIVAEKFTEGNRVEFLDRELPATLAVTGE
ncbi:MAG: hypothetical protein ABR611_15295 [Chthoniobacterales bacterium]